MRDAARLLALPPLPREGRSLPRQYQPPIGTSPLVAGMGPCPAPPRRSLAKSLPSLQNGAGADHRVLPQGDELASEGDFQTL